MTSCPACGAHNEESAGVCEACQALLHAPATDPFAPRIGAGSTLAQELSALALSEDEAADAFSAAEVRAAAVLPAKGLGTMPPFSAAPPPPVTMNQGKACATCGAANPAAAKFCCECGAPFARAPAAAPPAGPEASSARDSDRESEEEIVDTAGFAQAIEEATPPFVASIVIYGADGPVAVPLTHFENRLGATGAQVELRDPFVAPHAATLAFVEERLVLRDEGSANGIYLRVRGSAPLRPGDQFTVGERLLRWDGPVDLPVTSGPPYVGSGRPEPACRIVELLAGGRIGRLCHRAGPVISIGKSGCDLTFPGDGQLAARHAEVRLAGDGQASLVDLGAGPAGVFVRVPPRTAADLEEGDVLQVGSQLLQIQMG